MATGNNRALLLATSLTLSATTADSMEKVSTDDYNVVFILIDQLSARALAQWGGENIATPNIQRLSDEGVTFLNSVCVTPFSSPSRASLVTGLYPVRHGVIANQFAGDLYNYYPQNHGISLDPDAIVVGLDPSTVTTESILHKAGYATAFFGKWHLGHMKNFPYYCDTSHDVYTQDFRERFCKLREAMDPTPLPSHDGEVLTRPGDDQGFGFYQTKHMCEKWLGAPEEFRREMEQVGRMGVPAEFFDWTLLTGDALSFINNNCDRRFMVTVSLEPPHPDYAICDPYYNSVDPVKLKLPRSAYTVPQVYRNNIGYREGVYLGEEGTREKMRCYYGQVLFIDDMVGRILKTIDDNGIAGRTLVVFTSDHGDPQSSHGMLFGKSIDNFIDEVSLTPTIMRLPGIIPAGKKVQSHLNSVDFAPTILDYLGCRSPSPMDGRSIRPVVEGKEKDSIGFAVMTRQQARAVRGEFEGRLYCYAKIFNIKTGTFREELFDLTADPDQMQEVSQDTSYKKALDGMKKFYDSYAARYGDRLIDDLPAKGLTNYGNWKM